MPIKNNVLLIPILIDMDLDNIYLFTNNIFYEKWNHTKKNYYLLDYLLPSEDLDDLNKVQEMSDEIENYDFMKLIAKYDMNDYIILIIFKNKNEIRALSKINLNNSLKINNQKYYDINLDNEKDFKKILEDLKIIYEDHWKKINKINTSIKLPLTVSIKSTNYKKIQELEKALNEIDLMSYFYILKYDNQNTYYKIIYNGSPKTFLNDFNKRNINLKMEKNIWTVK